HPKALFCESNMARFHAVRVETDGSKSGREPSHLRPIVFSLLRDQNCDASCMLAELVSQHRCESPNHSLGATHEGETITGLLIEIECRQACGHTDPSGD